jgi:gliding-associated putative ABC transporter substrate-binding component GldG
MNMNFSKIFKNNNFSIETQSFTLGFLIVLLLINLLSINRFVRVDLTEDQQFTLSNTSLETVRNLDDLLTIKAYFSQPLPPDLASVSQYVRDILAEYQLHSSKIQVTYTDPNAKPETATEAEEFGIPQIQMNILQKDKFEIQNGYLGIVLLFQGKKETIPFIQDTTNLEYQLTAAIKKLASIEEKKVSFLTGNGEPALFELPFSEAPTGESYIEARKALEKLYTVNTITINNGIEINDVDTLIVTGTKERLSERELFEIDQFIMKGGNVVFLLDSVNLVLGLQAVTNDTGMEKLLENLGVKLNPDLVLDVLNETVSFSSGVIQFVVDYPFWVKAVNENFNLDVPVLSKLGSVVFPWVGSIELLPKEEVISAVLIKSTPQAGKMVSPFDLNPQKRVTELGAGQYNLAVYTKGRFKSLYPGQTPPKLEAGDAGNVAPTPDAEAQNRVGIAESEKESRILAVADSDFFADRYVARFPENMAFFLNMVDYLTLDESLVSIRSKMIADRPIRNVSDTERNAIKYLNILGIPFLVVALGVTRAFLRKKKRELA